MDGGSDSQSAGGGCPMSAEAGYFRVGARRHDAVLQILGDLEAVQLGYPDELVPEQAIKLQASLWEYLKAYGRRDERGCVDEQVTPAIQQWRPSPAQAAAHAAGLPVPPDEKDQALLLLRDEPADVVAAVLAADVSTALDPRPLVGGASLDLEDDGGAAGLAGELGGADLAVDGHGSTVEPKADTR